MQALEKADHNQMAAARLLGLTRSKFRSRLKNVNYQQDNG
jgi:transcriptional regulator with GAF, ATPase, and Fis domain